MVAIGPENTTKTTKWIWKRRNWSLATMSLQQNRNQMSRKRRKMLTRLSGDRGLWVYVRMLIVKFLSKRISKQRILRQQKLSLCQRKSWQRHSKTEDWRPIKFTNLVWDNSSLNSNKDSENFWTPKPSKSYKTCSSSITLKDWTQSYRLKNARPRYTKLSSSFSDTSKTVSEVRLATKISTLETSNR